MSIWPRSLAGIPGKLEPIPGLLDLALPGLLRALKGDGEVRSFGQPARVDDDWIVVVEGELGPMSVGEYLARHPDCTRPEGNCPRTTPCRRHY